VAIATVVRLVAAACAAHVLTMLSFSSFATLLPEFRALWGLSNTEAGWISASFFLGYVAAVPMLVGLTDRMDARRIYVGSAFLMALANLGFAALADGFWSAMGLRALAGVAVAGTYMPGLKLLTDHIDPAHQSRSLAFYVSCFSLGVALSYPLTGVIADLAHWTTAFAAAGVAALAAIAIVLAAIPASPPANHADNLVSLFDYRPVLRNRQSLAFSLCYAFHSWELFGFRAWIVAFLVFTETRHGAVNDLFGPTIMAGLITAMATPVSILGNEIAMRFGRGTAVAAVMTLSALLCFAAGFTSALSYAAAAIFAVVHGLAIIAESAAVTAGAMGHARDGQRGATMAVHTILGFGGGCMGPLAFGLILDWSGGESVLAWGLAFAHMGAVMLAGPLVLAALRPTPLAGDRR
jgi:MFS family permease